MEQVPRRTFFSFCVSLFLCGWLTTFRGPRAHLYGILQEGAPCRRPPRFLAFWGPRGAPTGRFCGFRRCAAKESTARSWGQHLHRHGEGSHPHPSRRHCLRQSKMEKIQVSRERTRQTAAAVAAAPAAAAAADDDDDDDDDAVLLSAATSAASAGLGMMLLAARLLVSIPRRLQFLLFEISCSMMAPVLLRLCVCGYSCCCCCCCCRQLMRL